MTFFWTREENERSLLCILFDIIIRAILHGKGSIVIETTIMVLGKTTDSNNFKNNSV